MPPLHRQSCSPSSIPPCPMPFHPPLLSSAHPPDSPFPPTHQLTPLSRRRRRRRHPRRPNRHSRQDGRRRGTLPHPAHQFPPFSLSLISNPSIHQTRPTPSATPSADSARAWATPSAARPRASATRARPSATRPPALPTAWAARSRMARTRSVCRVEAPEGCGGYDTVLVCRLLSWYEGRNGT